MLVKIFVGGPHYWGCSYATSVDVMPGVACVWSLFAASQVYSCTDSSCVVGQPCTLMLCVLWKWYNFLFCAVALCNLISIGPLVAWSCFMIYYGAYVFTAWYIYYINICKLILSHHNLVHPCFSYILYCTF